MVWYAWQRKAREGMHIASNGAFEHVGAVSEGCGEESRWGGESREENWHREGGEGIEMGSGGRRGKLKQPFPTPTYLGGVSPGQFLPLRLILLHPALFSPRAYRSPVPSGSCGRRGFCAHPVLEGPGLGEGSSTKGERRGGRVEGRLEQGEDGEGRRESEGQRDEGVKARRWKGKGEERSGMEESGGGNRFCALTMRPRSSR